MKFGMMTHFDRLKKIDEQIFDLKKQDSGRPMPGQVCGRHTQSYSAGYRIDTVRMPMWCILAQAAEYD